MSVIGDLIADVWLTGHAHHLCREAPVPTIDVTERHVVLGGAANAAANLAAMGADVTLVSAVGPDAVGADLQSDLSARGITARLSPTLSRTHAKTRAVVDGQILARIDEIAAPSERLVDADLPRHGAVLIADYGLGLDQVIDQLIPLRSMWSLLVVDAHAPEAWQALRPDVVTPNWSEASALLPPLRGSDRRTHVLAHRQRLLDATCASMALVTLDRDGCVLITSDSSFFGWTTPVQERFTIGAGDSATAAVLLALLASADLQAATDRAAAAARCAIRQAGTTVVSSSEVEDELHARIDLTEHRVGS